MSTDQERILCAAIYVDTGKTESESQSYAHPETGLMFCGWRHNDCFTPMHAWIRGLSLGETKAIESIDQYALRGKNQGFLTSKGRFVNRRSAGLIAFDAGQTQSIKTSLMSEDLY